MTLLDILIFLVLGVGLLRGVTTGVIRQVASIVGLVVAFVVALELMQPVGALVSDGLGVSEGVAPLLGFLLVFVGIEVVVFVSVRLLEALVGVLKLTLLNRALGGVFGTVKTAIFLSVVFLVLNAFNVLDAQARRSSVLYDPVASLLPATWDYVAEWMPEVERLSEQFSQRVHEHLPEGP